MYPSGATENQGTWDAVADLSVSVVEALVKEGQPQDEAPTRHVSLWRGSHAFHGCPRFRWPLESLDTSGHPSIVSPISNFHS